MQDLHLHSHLSDGLASPAEVVRAGASLGIKRLSITDHDCLHAHRDPVAAEAARSMGVELVPGVEVDCEQGGRELEILGYGFDPWDEALSARLDAVQVERRARFTFYCEGLAARGEPVESGHVLSGETRAPIKVHLYRVLLAVGRTFPGGYHEFKNTLDTLGPAPEIHKPSLEEAVALVRGAGGHAVLAHPLFFARRTPVRELLTAVAAAGCVGVELDYPYVFGEKGLPEAEVQAGLAALRAELPRSFPRGCLCTLGSDTHDLSEWPERLALLYSLSS